MYTLFLSSCVQRFDPPSPCSVSSGGVDFSPCARLFALGSGDGGRYLYDLRRVGGYLARLGEDSNGSSSSSSFPVTDVSFCASGRRLACGTQVWDSTKSRSWICYSI